MGPLLLRLIQVPADAWDNAVLYLRITTLGCLGNMGYNLNAGILRGLGNSRASLWMLVVSCIVNIVGDLAFVGGFGMGVGGAALATTAAMMLSWGFSLFYLCRHMPEIRFPLLPAGHDPETLREILRVGVPLGLNSALYSVGHILLQTLYNTQGSIFVAGCSVAGKLSALANIAITSFSNAASVFSGQNYGAGLTDRLRKGALRIPLACGGFTLTCGLLLTLFGRPVLALFTRDAAVLAVAQRYVLVVLPFTWCYAVFNGIMSYLNGVGEIRYPTIVNVLILWAIRIPSAWLLAAVGLGGYAMAGISLSFVAGMVVMLPFYCTRRWKNICRQCEKNAAGAA